MYVCMEYNVLERTDDAFLTSSTLVYIKDIMPLRHVNKMSDLQET